MTSLFTDILDALDQVILEVTDIEAGQVNLLAGQCDWSLSLFPETQTQQPFLISTDTPFLYDFLIDARPIWQGSKNARLRSGFWTEITANGQELHLEAIAIKQAQRHLLIIVNQLEDFKSHQRTKQVARELLLANDRLYIQNEYLHTRLLSILKMPTAENTVLTSLTKVIGKASFAVIIADKNLSTIIQNSAALTMFEQAISMNKKVAKPIDIITKLMANQLPEYERIISTKSSWDGEICWMAPPVTFKWLRISLYPVKTGLNEIENWIFFINDVSKIKHLTQRNEQLEMLDTLTELPNRYAFQQTLVSKVATNAPFYLLYIDINEFRRLNEFYGHEEGDKLLCEVGKRIRQVIKKSDFIARVGGDEFAIILTNITDKQHCKSAIQRILNSINMPFQTQKFENYSITTSIGAAQFPNDTQSVDELMKFVDLSTYSGKKGRSNSLQFYSKSIKDASRNEIEVEQELREAIKNDEFELLLQPILDIKSQKIDKAEALIRWNHPRKGVIAPDQFIAIAEKSGLIIPLGEWVIKRSCQIAKKLNNMGYNIKVSMNLSPFQVIDRNIFSHISDCVKQYELAANLLEVEVTEGVLVDDYVTAKELLSKIRLLGISVSVDDFGTGYSSLAYLKNLPLDYLKIDRSFVKDIATDESDKAIVKAVIAMAHNLNLSVITEGVETQEQLDFLTKNACNSVQGYFFSRPIKLHDFIKLVQSK